MGNAIQRIESEIEGSKTTVSPPADSPALQIIGLSPNSATLNWTPINGASQYQVMYQVQNSRTWINYATSSKTASVVTGLVSSTTYSFSLSATNAYGTGAPSIVTGITLPDSGAEGTGPVAPTQFQVTGTSTTSVALNWNSVTSAVQYQVQYQVSGSGSNTYSWITSGVTTNLNLTVTNLIPYVPYNFSVIAINNHGASSPAYISNFELNNSVSGSPPSSPTTFAVQSNTSNSVTLSWDSMSSAIQYNVMYQVVGTGNTVWIESAVTTGTICVINGMIPGTKYNFSVIAVNNYGASSSSTVSNYVFPLNAATGGVIPPTPGPVTGLQTTTVGSTSVSLSWTAPVVTSGSGPAIQYQILYQVSGSGSWTEYQITPNTLITITGLTPYVTYNFSVAGINSIGMGSSDVLNAIQLPGPTITGIAPLSPSGFRVSNIGVNNVTLTWGVVTGAVQYKVSYQASGSSAWLDFNTTNNSNLTVTGLLPLTTYNFSVVAINNYGISNPSFTNNIQLLNNNATGVPPPSPKSFTNSVTGTTSVTLTWIGLGDSVQYTISYQVSGTTSDGWIEYTTTSNSTAVVSGLLPLTMYNFAIVAINNYGNSGPTLLNNIQLTAVANVGTVPTSPTPLLSGTVTSTSVVLNWTASPDTAQYLVQYQVVGTSTTPSGWYEFAITNLTTMTVTGLQSYTPYNFSVTSVNNYGVSPPTVLSNVQLPGPTITSVLPTQPLNFQVTNLNSSTATLSWGAVLNTAQYQVQYQVSGSTGWVVASTTSTLSSTINGLLPYIPYNFSVTSINNYGTSSSSKLNDIILPGTSATGSLPSPPANLQGIPTSNTVALSWNASTGAIQYVISYQINGSSTWIEYNVTTSTTMTVNNLEPLVVYNFSIATVNNYGVSATNTTCQVKVLSGNVGAIPTSPLTLQVISTTTNSATLSWTSVPTAVDYIVYYQVSGSPDTPSGWYESVVTTNTNFTITNLLPSITYNFGVSSVNNWGASAMTVVNNTLIPTPTPSGSIPVSPTNIVSSALTTSGVTLTWTPVTGAIEYQILYQITGSSNWIGFGVYSTTTVSVTGLVSYLTYNFSVTAVNNYGASGPGTLANITIPGPTSPSQIGSSGSPPGVPGNFVQCTETPNSVALSWSAGSNAVQYIVMYQVSGSSSWMDFNTTANTSIVVTGLQSYVIYNFSVYSVNNFGTSSSSVIYNIQVPGPIDNNTPPSVPRGFIASNVGSTSVTLTWNAPTSGSTAVQYNLLYQVIGASNWIDFGTTANLTNTVPGLVPYIIYNFQLVAINNYGAGSPVQLSNVRTLSTGATGSIPASPSNFSVSSATTTNATLTWAATPGAIQYHVMYQLTGTSNSIWVEVGTTLSTTIVSPTLVPSISYNFSVAAINNYGSSLPNLINNYPMPTTAVTGYAPTAPTGLTVTSTTTSSASLSWVAPTVTSSASAAYEYNVLYQITGSPSSNWVDYGVFTSTTLVVSGLSPFITYTFNVISVNNFWSSAAASTTATLPASVTSVSPPSAPTGLTSTSTTYNTASLSWNASTGSVQYSISCQVAGSASTVWNEFGVTASTSLTVTGLSPMVIYNFEVIGINNGGTSSACTLSNITLPTQVTGTAPSAPTHFTCTSTTNSSASLNWDAMTGAYEYNILYQVNGASTWADFGVTTNTQITVTGLTPYVTYNFEITAINNYGNSPYTTLNLVQLLIPSNAATGTAPTSPTSVTSSGVTSTGLTLNWVAPTGGSSTVEYNVLYQINGATTWVDYNTTSSTSLAITGLVPYAIYNFQIIALNNYGYSSPGTLNSVQLSIPSIASTGSAPGNVSSLTSSNVSSTSLTLSWTAPTTGTSALQYNVLYQLEGASTWVEYNTTTSTSISVTGLNSYAIYNFQVISLNNYGASSGTILSNIQLGIPTNASTGNGPGAPTNLSVTASTSSSATLSWSDVSGAYQYNVMYQVSSASTWAETTVINEPTLTATISNLNPYGVYNFQVIAMNNYGQSTASQVLNYQLPPTVAAGTAPSAPTNLTATSGIVGSNSITLSWSAGTTGGTTVSYNVLYQVNNATTWYDYMLTTNTTLTINNLAASANYNFEVIAINNYGSSSPATVSSQAPNITPTGDPPTSPTNLSVTANSSAVTLSWTNVSTAVEYNIMYRIDGTSTWTEGGTSYSTPFTVPGLVNPIVYDFQLVAVNNYGASPAVTTVSGVAPGPPTNLTGGTVTTTSVPLTWTAPTTGATSYTVTYQIGSGSVTSLTGITTTSTTVNNLTAGTVYNFAVYAVNSYGTSTNASTVTYGTISPAPTGLAGASATLNGFKASWTATTGATSYNLSYQPSGGSYSTLTGLTGTSTTLSSLNPGIVYNFYLVAVNSYGSSAASSTVTYGTLCSTPTSFAGSSATTSSISLSWTGSTGAASYTVSYQPTGGSYSSVTGLSSTSTTISTLTSGTVYNFQIVGVNSYGNSASSSVMTYGTICTTPTGFAASNTSSSDFNLSWSSTTGASSYTVTYQPSGGSYSTLTGLTGTSTTISSLSSGTVYTLYITAVNTYGTSTASSTITYGTISPVPSGLTITNNSSTSVNVSWNTATGASSYTVTYQPSGGSTSTSSGLTETSTTISSLLTSTTYTFQIASVNSYGTSASSTSVSYTTQISSPSGLKASNSTDSSVDLSWSSYTGATSYTISYAGPTSGTVPNLTSTSTTVTGLNAASTYNFTISAVTSSGTSQASAVVTSGTTCVMPTGITFGNSSAINVSWTSFVTGCTGYNIVYVNTSTNVSNSILVPAPGQTGYNGPAYNFTSLRVYSEYKFSIYAVNNYGNSQPATTTWGTAPVQLLGVTVNSATDTSMSLSWSACTGATYYNISYTPRDGSSPTTTIVVNAPSTSTTFTGLNATANYLIDYQSGNSYTTAGSGEISQTTAPTPPTELTATSTSSTAISISWNAATSAYPIKYNLYYATPSGSSFTEITNVTSPYTFNSVSGSTYDFKIGCSDYDPSAVDSITCESFTAIVSLLPGAPQNVAIDPNVTTAYVTWTPADSLGTSFTVYWGYSTTTMTNSQSGITTSSYTITGLKSPTYTGTPIYVYVVTASELGSSPASSTVTANLFGASSSQYYALSINGTTSSSIQAGMTKINNVFPGQATAYYYRISLTGMNNWTEYSNTAWTYTFAGLLSSSTYDIQAREDYRVGGSAPGTPEGWITTTVTTLAN